VQGGEDREEGIVRTRWQKRGKEGNRGGGERIID